MSAFRVYVASELGEDGYPPAWHSLLKHLVRAQAGHRCVRCGHPYRNGQHGTGEWSPCDERCTHGPPVRGFGREPGYFDYGGPPPGSAGGWDGVAREAQWRVLTVHHLDGDKGHCRWWNLAALCQRCHLTIQGRVVMGRVWPWEHTAWFRPYVAAFYAHVYLGETLDRTETLARLDELLALGRAEASVERLPV